MRFRKKVVAATALAATTALLLAACSSSPTTKATQGGVNGAKNGFNAAVSAVINPSTKKGGTLKLISSGDCDSWDPARVYYGYCINMQRLMSRTLIGYSKLNGTSFKLAPDLATNMGTHSADYKTWTYTLKTGLKFSTGKAITPDDIKYAIERMYAKDVLVGSNPDFYFTNLIDAPASYKGPYNNGGDLPDSAISTTSDSITFHLKQPFADFNYLMALPTSAPVPKTIEGGSGFQGANYTKMPVSSGPFVITSYTPTKSVTFERNKYWSQSTDTIRKPLVDTIQFDVDSNPNDIDNKLAAGDYDALANTNVGPTLQTKIFTNATTKLQADDPGGAATTYFAIPKSVIPNVHCRRAIFYAMNKASLLAATGGSASGTIAESMTPPGIPGYDPSYAPYSTGKDGTGDIAKAKSELQQCGKPNGFTTKFAYSTPSSFGTKPFQAVQAALKRVGINITAAPAASESYYTTYAGAPANVKNQGLGIISAGWGADFPTLYGFYQNIVNGSAIAATGTSNYASIDDPTINKILNDTSTPVSDAIGKQLDVALMATAENLPTNFIKNLYYRNARLTNVTCNNALAFGIYDWVNIGVGG